MIYTVTHTTRDDKDRVQISVLRRRLFRSPVDVTITAGNGEWVRSDGRMVNPILLHKIEEASVAAARSGAV